jgi:hypothetical protein
MNALVPWQKWTLLLLLVALASMPRFAGPSGFMITDPFHVGESFAALPALLLTTDAEASPPLLIHGARNFVPAVLARAWFGEGRHFYPTLFIQAVLGIVTAVLFVAVALLMSSDLPNKWWLLWPSGLIGAVVFSEKDLFALLSLLLFLILFRSLEGHGSDWRLAIAFGVSVACGLFWAFDRGIASAVSLGAASLILIPRHPRLLISFGVFVIVVVALGAIHPVFSLAHYVQNVWFLIQTSSQWRYEPSFMTVFLTVFAYMMSVLAMAILLFGGSGPKQRRERLAWTVLWIGLTLFTLRISVNRADTGHVIQSIWIPVLLALGSSTVRSPMNSRATVAALAPISALVVAVIGFGIADLRFYALATWAGLSVVWAGIQLLPRGAFRVGRMGLLAGSWGAMLLLILLLTRLPIDPPTYATLQRWSRIADPPPNSTLVQDGLRWVADRVLASGSDCVFDLTNHGIIQGLTGLPSCTRFTYLVYADRSHESEMISVLRAKSPSVIVYSSDHSSYRIDGRAMDERFPALDAHVVSAYPYADCALGYCLRYSLPPASDTE